MQKVFDIVFDSRELDESGALLTQRLLNMYKGGKLLYDAAISEWQLLSNNMPIGGDTNTHISIMHHFNYDVVTDSVTLNVSTYALLRDIYRAYGTESTIPSISKIPGAIDLRITLSLFTR